MPRPSLSPSRPFVVRIRNFIGDVVLFDSWRWSVWLRQVMSCIWSGKPWAKYVAGGLWLARAPLSEVVRQNGTVLKAVAALPEADAGFDRRINAHHFRDLVFQRDGICGSRACDRWLCREGRRLFLKGSARIVIANMRLIPCGKLAGDTL